MTTYDEQLSILISNALKEDIGAGDYSTLSTINADKQGSAILKIKENCTLAGLKVAEKIFKMVEPTVSFDFYKADGDVVMAGEDAFVVRAKIHTILMCERLMLNIMQRMSGIATLTAQYTQLLKGHTTKLLDTRKTTPNFRLLEKEAVRIGGGFNHRMGLYDMVMLKDNHIDYSGGITAAVNSAYQYLQQHKLSLKIEVETRTLQDVEEALLTQKVDRIMLDNFSPDQIRTALKKIDGRVETEASGGINLQNLLDYAATGVDYISSGAVIHQAKSIDLSLKAIMK